MKKINILILLITFGVLFTNTSPHAFAFDLQSDRANINIVQERAHGNGIVSVREQLLRSEQTKLASITHNSLGNDYIASEFAHLTMLRTEINNKDLSFNDLHEIINRVYTDLRIKKLVLPVLDDVVIPASKNQDAIASYSAHATQEGKDLYAAFSNKKIDGSTYIKMLGVWNKTIVFPIRDYTKITLPTDITAITTVTRLSAEQYNADPEGTVAIVTTTKNTIQTNQNVLTGIKQAQDSFDQTLLQSEK